MNHSHQDQHPTDQYPNTQYSNDQYQPYPPAAAGGEAPAKKRRRWPWIAGIVVALLAGVGIGSGGEEEPEVVTETETETITEEVEVEVEVEPADLEERREAIAEDEELLETRASELDDREETLDAREEELASQAEEEAQTEEADQEETSVSDSGSIPGSGTFLIGEEIQPGTYRTEDTSGFCYWARLSGLSGEFDDIITNGIPEGQGFVTIAETDVAFETSDCGEWVAQ
ncbi:hypothetical protein I2485_08025 [Nesterenkonia sp. E16_7]|uniref:hypothetical protein n=1 Tax=unclassified Nesterenkonia TaxID=2629769 RepID=UPI001A910A08|nr:MULTISPECIES: hypothetical protein [unclassified Nesterenkonia]MBO0594944.1 hypothetical protein [Nesterenkonia sp. E16_10]MBO0598599.1 hypothetical protein [Nesterenkonia sp. E16_7]